MQKLISNAILLLLVSIGNLYTEELNAQATPPGTYSAMPANFVSSWDAAAPETLPNNLMTRPLKDVKQSTTYFDGLGRPVQTVVKRGSLETSTGTNADIVSPDVYDQYGREVYKYLSFAANNTGGNTSISDGLFKLNPFQQQVSFYNTQLSGQAGETNVGPSSLNWAYSKTNFEASPLNHVTDAYAPGASWVGSEGTASPHPVQMKYWLNTATDDVKIWNVTDVANGWGTYSLGSPVSVYPAGTLGKTATVDERGKQVIEFKDKEGKVILKKVQLTAARIDRGSGGG